MLSKRKMERNEKGKKNSNIVLVLIVRICGNKIYFSYIILCCVVMWMC